jgi:hypothetical protein
MWYEDGRVFIGKWNCDRMTEGKMFELQPDKTHSLFEVNYDEYERLSSEVQISTGHKLV